MQRVPRLLLALIVTMSMMPQWIELTAAESNRESLTVRGVAGSPQVALVVASAADTGPGTLRQALLEANPGDRITFDPSLFPSGAPTTIYLTTELPFIQQDSLTIDASDAGVILDGSGIQDSPAYGLQIASNANTIQGLGVVNFSGGGIVLSGGAQHNLIGGDPSIGSGPTGQGNMTSGNETGIGLWCDGTSFNTIIGNLIGTDASGTGAQGNHIGIYIEDGGSYNTIGPDNIIAYSDEAGVTICDSNSLGNTITQNIIHSNGGQGINLVDGGNAELDYPFSAGFDLAAGTITGGTCASCVVEVFSTEVDGGEVFEGTVTATSSGAFTLDSTASFTGPHLTMTATDPTGNTSGFSFPTSGTQRSWILQEGNDLPRTRVRTLLSGELEDNQIGEMSRLDVHTDDQAEHYVAQVMDHGVKWMRLSLDWFDWLNVEETEEYSRFYVDPAQDKAITELAANGVTMLYCLVFWDEEIEPVPQGYTRFKTETEIQRYLDYARFIVNHFKDRIEYYEILNESFYGGEYSDFSQQNIELADYINLVKRAVPVIHDEYPAAKFVAGPAPALYAQGCYDYEMGILASDAMPLVQAVSWHPGPYPQVLGGPITHLYRVPETIEEIKTAASSYGFAGEYLCEELAWSTAANPSPTEPWNVYSETLAAKYYARGIIDHLGMGTTALLAQTAFEGNLPKMDAVRNLSTVMAGAEPITMSVEVDAGAMNRKLYTFSLPRGSYLLATWRDGFAVEEDPGTPITLTLPGLADHDLMALDILHNFQQQMVADSDNDDLVVRNLLMKDYPVILRISSTHSLSLPLVVRGSLP